MDARRPPSRPRRSKPHIKAPSNGPPQLSQVDKIIKLHHGSTTAVEASRQRLQESKQHPILGLSERIEQLQKQNSNLRHEIAYYREMERHRKEFEDDVIQVKGNLEEALSSLGRIQEQVNRDWARLAQENKTDILKDSNGSEV